MYVHPVGLDSAVLGWIQRGVKPRVERSPTTGHYVLGYCWRHGVLLGVATVLPLVMFIAGASILKREEWTWELVVACPLFLGMLVWALVQLGDACFVRLAASEQGLYVSRDPLALPIPWSSIADTRPARVFPWTLLVTTSGRTIRLSRYRHGRDTFWELARPFLRGNALRMAPPAPGGSAGPLAP